MRILHVCATVAVLCIVLLNAAFAVQPDEIMRDPALEARARALSRGLRCMVCQNQSIDDSDAPLARDLRLLVRERIRQGDSDAQVINFLVDRYGSFVLLKPRFETQTLLLWLLPPFALGIGVLTLIVSARRRRQTNIVAGRLSASPLSPEERQKLAELIDEDHASDASPKSAAPKSDITKV
ncbi:cytochrome C biogenesis protein [Afipia sp. P52-10]|nr:cytochrome c-type biogenesis protein [Afipia sp. P52-10]ETR74720.1 cytochrome C biogenesis protein [Afipia sp. P52-10]